MNLSYAQKQRIYNSMNYMRSNEIPFIKTPFFNNKERDGMINSSKGSSSYQVTELSFSIPTLH
jgi:hypothetical protein